MVWFKPIATSVPGIQISEHFAKIAKLADQLAIVRSMTSKEGDHGRATYFLRTGYVPQGPVQYPSLGALVSKELGDDHAELPNFVSVAPFRFLNADAFGAGFLGPSRAPLIVGESGPVPFPRGQNNAEQALQVQDLAPPAQVGKPRSDARIEMIRQLQREFLAQHPDVPVWSHQNAYERAVRLMRSAAAKAFDLEKEEADVRDAFGRNLFGQGCLLARRLVEQVPFVEVTLNGWDTHSNNANAVRSLSATVDAAWGSLMTDLKDRGLLETTLIVWMGEFGRTPKFGRPDGRDHWPTSFSAVLAGGGMTAWEPLRSAVRKRHLADGRRMSFKDLNDALRINALPTFLDAASQLNGVLVCVGVEKAYSLPLDHLPPLQHDWAPDPLKKLLEICVFGGGFVDGLRGTGQNLRWITDDDAIVSTEKAQVDAMNLMGGHMHKYPEEYLQVGLGIASKFDDERRRTSSPFPISPPGRSLKR
jgi:hypothetical protein